MDEPTDQRRAQLANRRSQLSDAKQAALARRLRALGSQTPVAGIARAEQRTGGHVASFSQQRLWFVDQLIPGTSAYNLGFAVQLDGRLDRAALSRALTELVRRHDVLRTTFRERGGVVEQVVAEPTGELPVRTVDLSALPADTRAAERARVASEELARGFDLTAGPLLRATLVALDGETHELHLVMHHIISDGWSVGVMVQELAILYTAFVRGEASPLTELPVQYADVARWERDRLHGARLGELLAYWKRQLADAPAVLSLPQAGPRPAQPTFEGASVTATFAHTLREALQALALREDATLFMVLLAAFQVLLSRYSGQPDVIVGTPVANRSRPELEALIGFFVNTLAVRTDLSGEPTFAEALGRVKEVCLGAFAHQDLPFERLVEELRPERDVRYHPVYQVLFVLQNAPLGVVQLPGVELRPIHVPNATSKFDLTLSIEETADGLVATLEYDKQLFGDETARRMLEHLQILLEQVVAAPERSVTRYRLMTAGERALVLETWNTHAVRPAEATPRVHELVAAQAAQRPDAVAIIHHHEQVTYAELDERANRLAHHLRSMGVRGDVLVAIALERTVDMVVAVLAVWKAGGAYVPIDPSYPAARIAVMLEIARAPVLITQTWLLHEGAGAAHVVCLARDAEVIRAAPATRLVPGITGAHLSHVIFTSGSTGTPKGVAIRHASVSARLAWARRRFTDEELGGMLASTSLAFDLSVFELWAALAWGGKVILAGTVLEYPELPAREAVRLINTVPSAMAELVAASELRGVVTVNLAGEALPRELVTALYARPTVTKVYNLYGPSEDTTYSTEELVPREERGRPNIGRPLPGTRAYIVDAHREPVPVGVAGELYVAGCGLAREYLGRPDLTEARFVPDPFDPEPGARMYQTGDLARYLPDGRIDYLGRVDHQVKIRGFRIELGDIEAALRAEGMQEAVVIAREVKGAKQLVAYAAPAAQPWPSEKAVQSALARRLPQHMVPQTIVLLDALPLSPNGKIDRKALPAPPQPASEGRRGWVGARDPIEHRLVTLWEDLLDVRPIGITDDFFELGGHSLRVLGLAAEIERRFQRRLPIASIYRARTVADLAGLLRAEHVAGETPAMTLRAARGGRTLFCVHAASGNAFVYQALAERLGPHGLVGLHARGLTAAGDPDASVPAMAARYVAAIRELQPEGPYALAGWSLGGVVAYEMAAQLAAAGHEVDLVAMFDSWAPGTAVATAAAQVSDAELLGGLALDHELDCDEAELRALGREAGIERFLEAARKRDLLPGGAGRNEVDRMLRTFHANLGAMARYVPARPPAWTRRAVLFLAEETASEAAALTSALGWTDVCAGAPEIRRIGGSHRTIVLDPHVEQLAVELVEELSRLARSKDCS